MINLNKLIDVIGSKCISGNPEKFSVTDMISDPRKASLNTILVSETLSQADINVAYERGCRIFMHNSMINAAKGTVVLLSDDINKAKSKLCKLLYPLPDTLRVITVKGDVGVATASLILCDLLYKLGQSPVYFGYGDSIITHKFRSMLSSHDIAELCKISSSLCTNEYDTLILHDASALSKCYDTRSDIVDLSKSDLLNVNVKREFISDGMVYTEFNIDSIPFTAPYTENTTLSCVIPCIKYLLDSGFSLEAIANVLPNVRSVGRQFPIQNTAGYTIVVDSARTKDSLDYILGEYSRLFDKITIVIGSVGLYAYERHQEIAEAINKYCTYAVLTSDDPGYEDPMKICSDIRHEIRDNVECDICIDRYNAIQLAVNKSPSDSAILILGKGYENVQITGSARLSFDDMIAAQIIVCEKDR